MSDCDECGGNRQPTKRKRIWLIPIGVALLAIIGGVLWAAGVFRDRRSADERLAEIEAARAIPDAENAAVIYNELLQDPNATSLLDDFPESPDGGVLSRVLREPWLSRDRPELTAWVMQHQFIIDRLGEACRLAQCRFPISIDLTIPKSELDRGVSLRQWGYLLAIATNNDIAEGRIEAAFIKWRCLLRIESHLFQQPKDLDYLAGMMSGRVALWSMARFLVEGGATASHLREIEAMMPTEDLWAERLQAAREIESLRSQKLIEPFGPLDRIRFYVGLFFMKRAINSATGGLMNGSPFDDSIDAYRCDIRAVKILVALRRYRNATGRWPASLDEVRPSLPEEILTDPINQGTFAYKPTGDMFRLYSRGKNNIDEDARWDPDAGPDDWCIWPPRGQETKENHAASESQQ